MNAVFHQFTFGPDGPCTLESVSRIRKLWPLAPVYIWEDGGNRLAPEAADLLRDRYRCSVRPTMFPRGGNLNGKDCIGGMLSCYRFSLGAHQDATHVIKVDADTFVCRPGATEQAVRDDVFAAAWAFNGRGFSGVIEVLSRDLVTRMDPLEDVPGAPPSAPEDLMFGSHAFHLAGDREVRTWPYHADGGFCASYQYSAARIPLEEYVRRFEVITFGSRSKMDGVTSDCDKRMTAAVWMARAAKLPA